MVTRQESQEAIRTTVRRFYGASGINYYVLQVEYNEDFRSKLWRVYIDTQRGFELVEAKEAAVDCGSAFPQEATTHEYWKSLWERNGGI